MYPYFNLNFSLMYRMRNNPSGDPVIEAEISSACLEAKWLISPQHTREKIFSNTLRVRTMSSR
jgi:hypothetical protein